MTTSTATSSTMPETTARVAEMLANVDPQESQRLAREAAAFKAFVAETTAPDENVPTYSPGAGIVSQTLQYHGTADRYTLNGAASIAIIAVSRSRTSPTASAGGARSCWARACRPWPSSSSCPSTASPRSTSCRRCSACSRAASCRATRSSCGSIFRRAEVGDETFPCVTQGNRVRRAKQHIKVLRLAAQEPPLP